MLDSRKLAGVSCALALFALAFAAGCKTDHAAKVAESLDSRATPYARVDPATAGTIAGTVHFSGKAPDRVQIDMAQDPACNLRGGENDSEQYVVNNGNLANVFVYVKSGLNGKTYAVPSQPAVLDQKGCRYIPHVLGAMAGQTVEFRNSDPTMHNTHTMDSEISGAGANKSIDISQGPLASPQTQVFRHPELMMAVRCNNHPWMNAFINVVDNPFFAVTDASGHFEIKGLPPGVYTISAVHEQLGEQSATLTVLPQKTSSATFTFTMKK